MEAARAAAAPGWTGDIAWDEAVSVAMAEAPRGGETPSEREARVLKSVLDADIVPESKLGKVGVPWGGMVKHAHVVMCLCVVYRACWGGDTD